MNTILLAVGICIIAAALEGLFAGPGIKQRLGELRAPRYALPLRGWIVVAVFYYLICFVVLYRLFGLSPSLRSRTFALALVCGIMFINALWNYFFFRKRDLLQAFLIGLPYAFLVLILFLLLLRLDRAAAWSLLPYICYLPYAAAFGYQLWRLNPPLHK